MAEKTKLICITCPKGCTLEVTREGNTILEVDAGCKRGIHYAEEELNDPRRMVATTVRIQGSAYPLLPVATGAPFPKPMIKDLLKQLRQIEVSAPVKMGDVVLTDALGTGIDIIASRNM